MIHYHGTPMTPIADMVKAFQGRHAMVSFEHPEQIEVCAEISQSVVLDNGAFSAWRGDRPHDFDGYVHWCQKWLKHPAVDWCLIPDVIDGDYRPTSGMSGRGRCRVNHLCRSTICTNRWITCNVFARPFVALPSDHPASGLIRVQMTGGYA